MCGGRRLEKSKLDTTLAAIAEPTRRRVIDLLRKGPRPPSEIADLFRTTRPAMSRHLRVLRQAGLVREEIDKSDARLRVYRLEREPFLELKDWLVEVEGFWTEQLSAFKAHVEKSARKKKS